MSESIKYYLLFIVLFLVAGLIGVAMGNLVDDEREEERTETSANDERANDCDPNELYTMEMFPEFSFTYDQCAWEVREDIVQNAEGFTQVSMNLTQGETNLQIAVTPQAVPFSVFSECYRGEFEVLDSSEYVRFDGVPSEAEREVEKFFTYQYAPGAFVPGDDFESVFGASDADFCTRPSTTFLTRSNQVTGDDPTDLTTSIGLVSIFLNGEEFLDEADAIVNTLQY